MHPIGHSSALGRRGSIGLRSVPAAIALLVLLGVGLLLPALHFARVAHRICAEHGELVHDGSPAASESRAGELALVAGQYAGHEHEHCNGLALPPSLGGAGAPSWREPLTFDASAAAAGSGERTAHAKVALLFYAPKLAPPA